MKPGNGNSWLAQSLLGFENYYWTPGGPSGKTKETLVALGAADWKKALAIFLGDYAFERAGAPPSWGPLARDLALGLPTDISPDKAAKTLWRQFSAEVPKPNPKLNPLAISPTKVNVCQFIANLTKDQHNLIRWAFRQLRRGQALEANRQLQTLQGIGPKIAAFFLRDIVTSHAIDEGSLDEPSAILPVDVWVRRGVATLRGLTPEQQKHTSDIQIAEYAVIEAAQLGVRVATLDSGLWVLGARFARSPVKMSEALESSQALRQLLRREIERTEAAAEALRAVFSKIV
ncbi:MAG: hypothetical protein M3082_02265 [Candidatus Dormibacteraeota bacterium]|nr:hypothetical protein [Candidatus Dormibacteraeota bacterium]